ncbi:MAG TPA: pilus assembly protein TadG-related protein [Croceibacterium sp.]|nr:pilus assembly protein TadG-related protein [Croceibacterium sp.]
MRRVLSRFRHDQRGAIAPLYAIALPALIVTAGVGWDYGRMMAMDSELQNAADQAALAAASQLDGGDDAITRATAAAQDYLASADSQWANVTVMANDGEGLTVADLEFHFYESYDPETDEFGDEVTDPDAGADAEVVRVVVNGREAFFALTAVVGALTSGDITAEAVAGVETATCNVPPLMFCIPSGDSGFPGDDDIGKGISMHVRANQSDSWAPGNFGFLDIEYPNVDPNDQNHMTGLNSEFLGCADDVIESRTGSRTPEMRALNTRFDIYENGGQVSCDGNGNFCPAQNTTKNWVVAQSFSNDPSATGPACAATPNNPTWVEASTTPAVNTGFPQDTVTSNGYGNGTWNGSTYMSANHPGSTLADVPDLDGNGSISRYEVYEWELENPTSRLVKPQKVGSTSTVRPNGRYNGTIYCAYPRPISQTPVVPSETQKDRRLMTVAAVDCSGLNGHAPVDILRWVDLFLVQPASSSNADKSFYTEVVGVAAPPGADQASFQYYGKNKPVLLR